MRIASADSPQRLQPTHARHGQIHDDHVGRELEVTLACDFAGLRFGDR